jgi:hypothetical protein
MPLVEKPLVLSAAQGGERQRSSLSFDTGYSAKAHCIGNPASTFTPKFNLYIRGYRQKITQQSTNPKPQNQSED